MADIIAQVMHVSPTRDTKREIIDYYRATYPGVRTDKRGRTIEAWRGQAATAYAQQTGLSRASALREFQGKRASSTPRKNAETWQKIGGLIPPRAPDGGYHITGLVYITFSDGECEEREVDETITGDDAQALLDTAVASDKTWRDVTQLIVNHYMQDPFGGGVFDDEGEPTAHVGDCQPPQLTVEAIEDEE